jgi:flagellar hook protein FlgE
VQGYAAIPGALETPAGSGSNLATTPGSALQVTFTTGQPKVTAAVKMAVNLDSNAAILAGFTATPPTSAMYNHTTSVTVFDSLGKEHTLGLYFRKDGASGTDMEWEMMATMDGAVGATTTSLTDVTPGIMSFPVATGQLTGTVAAPVVKTVTGTYTVGGVAATPFSITLDLTGTTMFSGKFGVNTLTQNGYGKGDLAGMAVTKDGLIQAQYTNGQALTIGRLSLTSFINPNGMQAIGENHWIATPEAGTANTQQPNSGVLGLIQSSAVEESNVDLTAELVNLIVAQRMYQANAQTIKAQDQILQTLVNLR